MAFNGYVRLVASGVMRGTQTWSIGMSFATPIPHTNTELFAWLAPVDTAMIAFYNTAAIKSSAWDTTTSYGRVAAYQYLAAGNATAQAQVISSGVTGVQAAGAPSQCSLVISIRSGLGSRDHRGRVYLPMTGRGGWANSGQLASADCNSIATAFKALVNTLNLTTIGGAATTFGIASRGSGFTIAAQDCVIDSKIDTQRRRADKVLASSRTVAVF
jgi:hypothetical protein